MKLIINIPAFNEEDKLSETIKQIPQYFDGIDEVFVQVIDDGSTDNTLAIAKDAGAHFIYSNGINRGIGKTFRHAVEKALENGVDIMINIDADGQFNPQDIKKIIAPILNYQADIVSADRFSEHKAKNIPWIKDFMNRFAANLIGRFMNTPIKDLTCGFRAYNREALLRLNLPGDFTYTQETIIDALGKDLKIQWVPVEVVYFAERKSRVVKSVFKYINNSARIILRAVRDVRPMKFFGIPGTILMLLSFVFFGVFLFNYFIDFKISPYRNQLFFGAGFFIVGLQFVVFALMADMIRSNRRLVEDQIYLTKKELYKNHK
jgi:glycosyltransferase involved in cell wall biosynthesis